MQSELCQILYLGTQQKQVLWGPFVSFFRQQISLCNAKDTHLDISGTGKIRWESGRSVMSWSKEPWLLLHKKRAPSKPTEPRCSRGSVGLWPWGLRLWNCVLGFPGYVYWLCLLFPISRCPSTLTTPTNSGSENSRAHLCSQEPEFPSGSLPASRTA